MSLSFCLLTRNQERILERCLRSIAVPGAEVIVGDTGSTDGTVAAARALGAKVLDISWQNDFGAAQNQALDQATGEWVFWLNPDEELLPVTREQLGALLNRPDAFAFGVRLQEAAKAEQRDGFVETLQLRLFRRHPSVRYIGRIHPHFVVPLEELARGEGKEIYGSQLLVRHHAYLSTLTADKLRWSTRLLELELQDRPGQLHYLIEYGRHLLRLNDVKGHTVLAEASELVLSAWEAPAAPSPTVASLLEYLLTVSAQQSCSRLKPQQARELALRWFPNAPPLLWCMSLAAFQAEDFQEAAGFLERLVHLGQTGTYDRSAAFDPSIMRESALLNLGACYIRLHNLDRAALCFGQVLESPTHQTQARKGHHLVQNLLRRQKRTFR